MAKRNIKVQEVRPSDITFDDRNLNLHTDRGKQLVEKSFQELGAGRSGLADKHGKMIAGNLSAETAIAQGLKIVEVETEGDTYVVVKRTDLDLDSKTDNRARKLALADNSTAAASLNWNWEEMQTQSEEFGFDVGDWGVELPEKETPKATEDSYQVPEVINTDIVLGDLFEFRKGELLHRLLCGDSTDSDAVGRLMGGEKAATLITDPPYQLDFDYANTLLFCENANVFIFNNDRALIRQLAASTLVFKKFFVFYHSGCAIPQEGGNEAYLDHVIVSHESLGEPLKYQKGDGLRTVIKGEYRRSEFHPHEKPFSVLDALIRGYSFVKTIVLDFYAGSGSLFIAAHQLERNCYGMELDPKYCQVIVDRMHKLDPEIEIIKNGKKYKATAKKNGLKTVYGKKGNSNRRGKNPVHIGTSACEQWPQARGTGMEGRIGLHDAGGRLSNL